MIDLWQLSEANLLHDETQGIGLSSSGSIASSLSGSSIAVAQYYGYSVYTTFRASIIAESGLIEAHLNRLVHNAQAMNLSFKWPIALLHEYLHNTLKTLHRPEQNVLRLTVFPEVTNWHVLGNPSALAEQPTRLYCSVREVAIPVCQSANKTSASKILAVMPYHKVFPTVKHGAMAESLRLLQQARSIWGCDDVLWQNPEGKLTETTTANFFGLRQTASRLELLTAHPAHDGCLPGITRQQVLTSAQAAGIHIVEEAITAEMLSQLSGAFITNAVMGIQPVGQVLLSGEPVTAIKMDPHVVSAMVDAGRIRAKFK